jgi:hypothetical protein
VESDPLRWKEGRSLIVAQSEYSHVVGMGTPCQHSQSITAPVA